MEILSQRQRHVVSLRFTLDGSDELEERLSRLCETVREGLEAIVPANKLEALVLGGGYGRGQGGVLKTESGDAPYNDLEFYVFLRGNRLWNQRAYKHALHELGERLSTDTLHLEFKVDSLARLRRSAVSMFSYDLVSRHRVVYWEQKASNAEHRTSNGVSFDVRSSMFDVRCPPFHGCEQHLAAENIPLSEATRLLFNRCTGLLLVKDLLLQSSLTLAQSDFIGRNLAKAQLAMGDTVLAALRKYHWNCVERHERLEQTTKADGPAILPALRRHHALGVEFKLHPERIVKSARQFATEHEEISALARQLWLWLESKRLSQSFASTRDYAFSRIPKCPEISSARSFPVNLKTFGPGIVSGRMRFRYPRERLLNTLPLLLWDDAAIKDLKAMRHLRIQLRTSASDWPGLVARYKALWPQFG